MDFTLVHYRWRAEEYLLNLLRQDVRSNGYRLLAG